MGPGEWEGASKARFTLGGVEVTLWVMNDHRYIYFALLVDDDDLDTGPDKVDRVIFYFDSDADGVGPEQGEDMFAWNGFPGEGREPGYYDLHTMEGSYIFSGSAVLDSVQDGVGKASLTLQGIFFEFSKPLVGSSPDEDFQLSYGDEVGFAVRLSIDSYDRGMWPSSNYAEFALYEVASPPSGAATTPPPTGGGQPVTSSGGGHAVAIAFSKRGETLDDLDSDLWVTSESGAPVARLSRRSGADEYQPSASDDGSVIAFSAAPYPV